jgi:Fe-coproporphyrin III synthase
MNRGRRWWYLLQPSPLEDAVVPDHKSAVISSLPLVTLHLTERCNSRCISCDYWRHGRRDVSPETIDQLLPELKALGTRVVLISGGEPLVHPHWRAISERLRDGGLHLWLHTAGLALAKHASDIVTLFDAITVSLDGIDREMYLRIRGVDAFDRVCAGIHIVTGAGARVGLRVTVQRGNYTELPRFVKLAHELEVSSVSFLAADVSNAHAFGREPDFVRQIALQSEDLPRLAATLQQLRKEHTEDFSSGFIVESPDKLERLLLRYFAALCGLGPFPPVRCNAPEFSAVLSPDGRVHPCFFIAGPNHVSFDRGLAAALDDASMQSLRSAIRERQRPECARCVCSLWREPEELREFTLIRSRGVAA